MTDFANFNVTYFRTTDIREELFQGSVAKLDHSQNLLLDLVVKF